MNYSAHSELTTRLLQVHKLGLVPYREAWELQRELHRRRVNQEIPDTLLLLEHPPVYTLGKNADPRNLLNPGDAEVVQTDRGGDVTWHGPGQLVGYPIFDLKQHRPSVSWYMRSLEEVIIRALQTFGVEAGRIPGLTGVWIGEEKICALGVRLSRWVTLHGFALNICPNLSYFSGMIPCGIRDKGVTSLCRVLGRKVEVAEVIPSVVGAFQEVFSFDQILEEPLTTSSIKE